MPLGDSLTWGWDGSSNLSTMTGGGYRSELDSDLTNNNYAVTYVGVNQGNPSATLNGQVYHNGFNGYTIGELDGNLNGSVTSLDGSSNLGGYWLTGGHGTGRGAETAQVILIQAGTNDITQGYNPNDSSTADIDAFALATQQKLKTLIDDVMSDEGNALILVDGAPPLENSPNLTAVSLQYDLDVSNMISTTYAGTNVHYVDMVAGLLSQPTPGYEYYTGDGIHLDPAGYAQMGDVWASAIEQYSSDIPSDVPEPSTNALLISGALALFAWRKLHRVRARAC